MILQQDSIVHNALGAAADTVAPKHNTLTPATVLSWLPRDATPAQQDSMVQAYFKPSEIQWSQRPDTLHLPGHDKGHNLLDVQLPQYYKEGFFSKDSLFHPELPGGCYGVAGDPVPYNIQGDSIITLLLLGCFIFAVVAFANTRHFFIRQLKHFFYMPQSGTTEVTETANEVRFQGFLLMLTSLLMALLYYFYTIHYIGDTFYLSSLYHLIAIYFGMTVAYFLLKGLVYLLVNMVFFDSKKNRQWIKSMLFITTVEGVLLFPAVILLAYFNMSVQNVAVYFTVVLIFVKLLTIYKCYAIFFRQNVVQLQIFLYFCALELVPLLAFGGALALTADSLKINF